MARKTAKKRSTRKAPTKKPRKFRYPGTMQLRFKFTGKAYARLRPAQKRAIKSTVWKFIVRNLDRKVINRGNKIYVYGDRYGHVPERILRGTLRDWVDELAPDRSGIKLDLGKGNVEPEELEYNWHNDVCTCCDHMYRLFIQIENGPFAPWVIKVPGYPKFPVLMHAALRFEGPCPPPPEMLK